MFMLIFFLTFCMLWCVGKRCMVDGMIQLCQLPWISADH